jgi:uncharacterized membrane protein
MLVMVFLGYFLFKKNINEIWKVSGLLVGVYSGGTPNIAAIKMVLNVDDFLVTTTALAMSPPFVPVIAAALKNKKVIIPGLVVGIIGYAVGNYLGVFVATVLK